MREIERRSTSSQIAESLGIRKEKEFGRELDRERDIGWEGVRKRWRYSLVGIKRETEGVENFTLLTFIWL